jgi:hypothetical protein
MTAPNTTQTEQKHTPGPWALYHGHDRLLYVVAPKSKNKIIATPALVCNSVARNERMEANARLIAAAPDLLRLLKRNLTATECLAANMKSAGHDPIDQLCDETRALIAKIESQP